MLPNSEAGGLPKSDINPSFAGREVLSAYKDVVPHFHPMDWKAVFMSVALSVLVNLFVFGGVIGILLLKK